MDPEHFWNPTLSQALIGPSRRQKIGSPRFSQRVLELTDFQVLHQLFIMAIFDIPKDLFQRFQLVTVHPFYFVRIAVEFSQRDLLAVNHLKVARPWFFFRFWTYMVGIRVSPTFTTSPYSLSSSTLALDGTKREILSQTYIPEVNRSRKVAVTSSLFWNL